MNQAKHQDWHPARVKYELAMRGLTLADVGRELGYGPTSAYDVLRRRLPKVETAVAAKLGKRPREIWPSRYCR